jgi:Cu2+-exporting ATPase
VCDPLLEPTAAAHARHAPPEPEAGQEPSGHEAAAPEVSPHDMMGHGGHGGHGQGGMSMAAMVADMRNRFLVAAVLSIPVLLWSPIGREVLGFTVAAPFGLRVAQGEAA